MRYFAEIDRIDGEISDANPEREAAAAAITGADPHGGVRALNERPRAHGAPEVASGRSRLATASATGRR